MLKYVGAMYNILLGASSVLLLKDFKKYHFYERNRRLDALSSSKSNMYVMCTVLRRNISIVLYVAQQHDTI